MTCPVIQLGCFGNHRFTIQRVDIAADTVDLVHGIAHVFLIVVITGDEDSVIVMGKVCGYVCNQSKFWMCCPVITVECIQRNSGLGCCQITE